MEFESQFYKWHSDQKGLRRLFPGNTRSFVMKVSERYDESFLRKLIQGLRKLCLHLKALKKFCVECKTWGGYLAAKRMKLDDQLKEESRTSVPKVTSLFAGISIHVNGYTDPPESELKLLMLMHGGTYHFWPRRDTSYIVANSLATAKIDKHKNRKVVKPEWVVESVKAGKLLDYRKYSLFADNTEQVIRRAEHGVPRTAADPHFIEEFQKHSRLHYISEMATKAKRFVASLRQNELPLFPGAKRLYDWKMKKETSSSNCEFAVSETRVIMHIDIDCFFASVAMRDEPELADKPVAVTHGSGKQIDGDKFNSLAEIASCNYIARAQGVRNGMFLGEAFKLCPTLQLTKYKFEEYEQVSQDFYKLLSEFTLDIEAVSCDEAYIDMTALIQNTNTTPLEAAEFIKQEMKEKTGCTTTTGMGPNRLVARLATKLSKPDGIKYVPKVNVLDFMQGIKVSDVPGIGYQRQKKLHAANIFTCGDLQKCQRKTLKELFGNNLGLTIYSHCRGIDDSSLKLDYGQKSVSVNINFGVRLHDDMELENFLKSLAESLCSELKAKEKMAKTITLRTLIRAPGAPVETAKYMGHGECTIHNKSWNLLEPLDQPFPMYRKIYEHVKTLHDNVEDFRGFGLIATHLVTRSENQNKAQKSLIKTPRQSDGEQKMSFVPRLSLPKKKTSLLYHPGPKTTKSLHTSSTSPQGDSSSTVKEETSRQTLEQTKQNIEDWFSRDDPKYFKKQLTVYFLCLVNKRRLEELCSIMSWLNRRVKNWDSAVIKEAVVYVVKRTQKAARTCLGAELELE